MLTTMRDAQNLLIVGKAGLGKTREALELIRRIEKEGGEEVSVLLPLGALEVPYSIPQERLKRIVVLFLDNLPRRYSEPFRADNLDDPKLIEGDFRHRFEETVRVFESCLGTKFHVIATAIGEPALREKLHLEEPFWRKFTILQLPDLAAERRPELLRDLEQYLGLAIAPDAQHELCERSDGTFAGLIVPLLSARGKKKVTLADIQDYRCTYPKDWEQRVYGPHFSNYIYRKSVLAALGLLRQANILIGA
jgi:hypothetical protein